MKNRLIFFIVLILFSPLIFAESFSHSKKELNKIYTSGKLEMKAFYSNCNFTTKGKKLLPILSSCDYQVRKNENRANRIEWEHVMPAHHLGLQLQCWKDGGRKNCKKVSQKFKKMEADMHNLVPAIGEMNGDRSNFKFGMIEGEHRKYGSVDFEIDFKSRTVEPPSYVKGNIARIYFYMREKYGIRISKKQTKLFNAWDKTDPVDNQEKLRNKLINKVQGNYNKYVSVEKKMKASNTNKSGFECGSKKYCKDMVSCSEAKFYLYNCGLSKLDRDKDGIPCESICN
ncbi:MAG: endonuclease [Cocleimonas sp.]|nr:endonuclease [Cocleimonas sp.]